MNYSIIQKSQLEGASRLDAEYFQPEYLEIEKRLNKTGSIDSLGSFKSKFITGPFGSEFNVENYVVDGKYRYVRGKDVKEFFIQDNDNVYVPQKDFERLKKYALEKEDILISVVGTLGNTSIVEESIIPAIFSCKSTIFRSKSINPYYFITYLNSYYGKSLLQRCGRGHVQIGLNINDLRNLPVFIPSDNFQRNIELLVKLAKETIKNSESFYSQAENLLLEELGLKDFKIEDDLSFVVNLSDVKSAQRADAEYFQPKYKKLISKLKAQNSKLLGALVSMRKGFEPGSEAYQEGGKLFIRVSSLSKFGVEDKDQKYLSDDLYQKLRTDFESKVGEILVTKDATPGIAYVLKEPVEGIISGGILRLKLKNDIDPEYLALFINSIIGQWQAERDAGGSVIAHWKPEQIRNLLIPILPKSTQQKIADLVQKSHEARKKSKEILEEAKRKVETSIETQSKRYD